LIDSETWDIARKKALVGMQASVILANLYTSQVQQQLQVAEEKRKKPKKRLMGDGKAKLFSGDEFYNLCVEDEEKRQQEEAEAKQRKAHRENHAVALVAWREECEAVRERNRDKRQCFDEATRRWEEERGMAKSDKRRFDQPQPKWKQDFAPEALPARPKKRVEDDSVSEGEDNESDG
jgi:hypothetical protein